MKTIAVVGTGYVGLVTGACLAKMGHLVTCIDTDREKIAHLLNGRIPFYEKDLKTIVEEMVEKGHLHFTTDYEQALNKADLCFLALPTPSAQDGSCDLSYILEGAKRVGEVIASPIVVVNKSTVALGTGAKIVEEIERALNKRGVPIPFEYVFSPEFLKEGSAVADALYPDRIVIGTESRKGEETVRELYAHFQGPILTMDIVSAELCKYASNAMLASRISMINHLAELSEEVGADIERIKEVLTWDKRIGKHYLSAGLGFGGSCLPKDVKALCSLYQELGLTTPLLDAILTINQRQCSRFLQKITNYFGDLEGKTLSIWGLSFKPNTDDMRKAPSLEIIQELIRQRAYLKLHDPVAIEKAKQLLHDQSFISFCDTPESAAEKSDGILLITEWDLYERVNFAYLGELMDNRVLFDGRNFLKDFAWEDWGFDYFPVGQQTTGQLVVQ